jgi:hypothetical protein
MVQVRFTFTKVGEPGEVRVLDTGLEGLDPIVFNSPGPWHWVSDLEPGVESPSPYCTDFHAGIADRFPRTFCDCNNNGLRDKCDIEEGTSADCNTNGVPDECDPERGDTDLFVAQLLSSTPHPVWGACSTQMAMACSPGGISRGSWTGYYHDPRLPTARSEPLAPPFIALSFPVGILDPWIAGFGPPALPRERNGNIFERSLP